MKKSTVTNVKRVCYAGLIIAIGMLLPQLFHMFGGQASGTMFLPMHLPVLLAGMILGPWWGLGIAVVLPVFSSLITGMPPVPVVYFMLIELSAYAVISGFCARKMNPYFTLVLSLVGGRLFYAGVLFLLGTLFKLNVPAVGVIIPAFVTGLPGIALQLIFIPPIWYALRKGGLLLVYQRRNRKSY